MKKKEKGRTEGRKEEKQGGRYNYRVLTTDVWNLVSLGVHWVRGEGWESETVQEPSYSLLAVEDRGTSYWVPL